MIPRTISQETTSQRISPGWRYILWITITAAWLLVSLNWTTW